MARLEQCAICRSPLYRIAGIEARAAKSCAPRTVGDGYIGCIARSPYTPCRCTGTAGTGSESGRLRASSGSSRWTLSGSYGH